MNYKTPCVYVCLFSWKRFVEMDTERHTYHLVVQVVVSLRDSRIYLRFLSKPNEKQCFIIFKYQIPKTNTSKFFEYVG